MARRRRRVEVKWEMSVDGDTNREDDVFLYDCMPPPCSPDWNGDGCVNSQDFAAFLNAFVTGDPGADYNGDGAVNSQDFVAFLNDFAAGEPRADVNGDGQVDSRDFVEFLNAFVHGC
jgi:hypothetical protein